jgi:hypothetical protein
MVGEDGIGSTMDLHPARDIFDGKASSMGLDAA